MKINRIAIENFLVHGSTEADMADLTLLVGSNGGGKSALLESLFLLGRIAGRPLSNAFTEVGPLSFGSRLTHGRDLSEEMRFTIEFEANERVMNYDVMIGLSAAGQDPAVKKERLSADGLLVFERGDEVQFEALGQPPCEPGLTFLAACKRELRGSGTKDPALHAIWTAASALGRVLRFRLDPYAVARDVDEPDMDVDDTRPRAPNPGPRGEGTAAYLYWLSDFERPRLRSLQESLQAVIPTFGEFEFTAAEPGRIGFGVRYTDRRGVVPARNLSSGTLSVIGLICVLTYSSGGNPPVLCIEEPELGLTPTVTTAVFDAILKLRKDRQVVLTSHSPHLVHRTVTTGDALVLRAALRDGAAQVEPFESMIRREAPPGTMAKLRDQGGMGVQTALRLLEDLV